MTHHLWSFALGVFLQLPLAIFMIRWARDMREGFQGLEKSMDRLSDSMDRVSAQLNGLTREFQRNARHFEAMNLHFIQTRHGLQERSLDDTIAYLEKLRDEEPLKSEEKPKIGARVKKDELGR